MAEVNGYLETIESAGGYIFTDSCPPTIGPEYIGKYHGMVFDSYKMCKNLRNKSKADIYFGDVKACLDAAISGKWEADQRWKK
jgi:predicted aconitase